MWNIPMDHFLADIPALYATEDKDLKDKLIYIHFFLGNSEWYVAEYNGKDLFWGFVILGGNFLEAEWGYFSFSELQAINAYGVQVDCVPDEYWPIRPAAEIDNISQANGWNLTINPLNQFTHAPL